MVWSGSLLWLFFVYGIRLDSHSQPYPRMLRAMLRSLAHALSQHILQRLCSEHGFTTVDVGVKPMLPSAKMSYYMPGSNSPASET